ncbi:VOC family protein [Carnobacterium maltaromaticum]|uniref:VOC family protein n=1 Tax=Carnobacterium maltaromaticum TaxID=2751 RepID=UPI0039BEBCF0
MSEQTKKISTFLTFSGNAEKAMNLYVSLFEDAKVLSLTHFGEGDRGVVGQVMNGEFEINGQSFMVMDMEKQYAPELNWGVSIFVRCQDEAEFDRLFTTFSEGGSVMMGPEAVNHLRKVAWVTDSFGITWQLIWE